MLPRKEENMEGDYRPFGGDSEHSFPFWAAAAAVCVGTLAANVITWAAAELRLRWELDQVTTIMRRQTGQDIQSIERSQREAARELQRQATERDQREAQRRQQLAEQQRAENDLKRAAQEETNRKEAAWKRFYKPSQACIGASSTVECANEHIRATREFERRFAAGEL
jgi:hypothetical protein